MKITWQIDSILQILFILSITALLAYLFRRVLSNFKQLSKSNLWLKSLGDSLYNHVNWAVWSVGALFAIDRVISIEECPLPNEPFKTAKQIILLFIFSALLLIWKSRVEKALIAKVSTKETSVNDRELISVIGKLTTVFIAIVGGFILLDILDVPLQALLAFGGIGSLAVTWAAKDVIANFFGGAMIFINRPFVIGDWIKSPNRNFEGVVEDIGWYMTRIRKFERVPTFIPNALITDAIIENPGRMYNRRIKKSIGIRYSDFHLVQSIVQRIEEMLKRHPEIDQGQFLFVHFEDFGPYSLDIGIYCFTKSTKWIKFRSVQQDILLKIGAIIAECGAEIAFPTNTLHLDEGSNEKFIKP